MLAITNRHCDELRMLALRQFVEAEANFDMKVWIAADEPTCHTAMCIGGSTAYLMSLESRTPARAISEDGVSDWLGISRDVGTRLFYCCNNDRPVYEAIDNKTWYRIRNVTRAQALQAIDNIVKDGAPHWDVICEDIDVQYELNKGWD